MELFAKIVNDLTLSWRRQLSYRNQSIDLLCKSVDWFLYMTASVMKDLKSIDLTQVLMSFGAEDIFKNVFSLIYYNSSLRHRFGSLWWENRNKKLNTWRTGHDSSIKKILNLCLKLSNWEIDFDEFLSGIIHLVRMQNFQKK